MKGIERFREEASPSRGDLGPVRDDFFTPLAETERDKFGNRFLASGHLGVPKGAHMNKNQNNRSGLLVSPEGLQLIRTHHKLLSNIDKALAARAEGVEVDNDLQIEHIGGGRQSEVFEIIIDGKRYIGKIQTKPYLSDLNLNQSYVFEMLQIQTFGTECAHELEKMNISMPKFYFSTSQFTLREYIEGEQLSKEDGELIEHNLVKLMKEFLAKKNEENKISRNQGKRDVWEGVDGDLYDEKEDFKVNNFLKIKSGKIIFIDPFKYDP